MTVSEADAREVIRRAREAGVSLVRFLYCDNGNVIRGKACHVEALPDFLPGGIGMSLAMQAFAVTESIAPGTPLGPVGEFRLLPDLSTFQPLPYLPGQARLLCDMTTVDGAPWAYCPRGALRGVVERAASVGLEVQAGFENEFYLATRSGDGFAPADDSLCYSARGMDLAGGVVGAIVEALGAQGLPVLQYHPELGPGQQELSLRPSDAVTTADRQIVLRETVRGVAVAHGLAASFAPKPFPGQSGSGCHLHLSLWREGANAFHAPSGGMTPLCRQFVAGVLAHAPALLAVTCPSVNSYARLQPSSWSSAFVTFGPDNREATVRVPSVFRGREASSANIELKAIDGSANPYLALAAVLACGLDGIARELDPGEAVEVDPATLPEAVRGRRGMARYPADLGTALAAFEQDAVVQGALGPELSAAFAAVRRTEWEAMREADAATVAARYFTAF